MSLTVVSTLQIDGLEKLFCMDGGWVTIGHAAHLSGNSSKLVHNSTNVIQCLLKRYPQMRSRIRLDKNRFLLETFDYNDKQLPIDLFFSITDSKNESWQKMVEDRCHCNPFSDDGTIIFPLVHFILFFDRKELASSDNGLFHLLLFTHHVVSDGRSGYILINDFLTLATSPNLTEFSEPINTELLPFIDQYIPRPYRPLYPLLARFIRFMMKRELRKPIEQRIPVKSIPLDDSQPTGFNAQRYKLKFLFSSSSPSLYKNLHEQCRSHQITLNGPLFGCVLLAIHHCFPLKDKQTLQPYSISVPFDMRQRLPQSPLTPFSVGCYVAGDDIKLDRTFPLQSTQFWSFAHQCMTATMKKLGKDGIPLVSNVFVDMARNGQQLEEFLQLSPEGRVGEFMFSNIGKYQFPCMYNNGEVQLHGLHVINSETVHRISATLFITCVDDNQLDFSLAHEIESDEKANEFLDFYTRLVEVCSDKSRCQTSTTLGELLSFIE